MDLGCGHGMKTVLICITLSLNLLQSVLLISIGLRIEMGSVVARRTGRIVPKNLFHRLLSIALYLLLVLSFSESLSCGSLPDILLQRDIMEVDDHPSLTNHVDAGRRAPAKASHNILASLPLDMVCE